ncbi:MAG: septum formation initiator family protein [Lachnospiraceae bacterium]|jgi:cell division protein DivIC|nr:septum formation initiator family protein [Lachnospiraceae bacterium]
MGKREEARRASAQRTRMRRRKKHNKSGVLCVSLIVLIMAGVMSVQIVNLYRKNESYHKKERELQAQVESEEQRKIELEEYEEYINTKEYIEQVAKTKLGLVYENEIVFKENTADD